MGWKIALPSNESNTNFVAVVKFINVWHWKHVIDTFTYDTYVSHSKFIIHRRTDFVIRLKIKCIIEQSTFDDFSFNFVTKNNNRTNKSIEFRTFLFRLQVKLTGFDEIERRGRREREGWREREKWTIGHLSISWDKFSRCVCILKFWCIYYKDSENTQWYVTKSK